jgi:hypothetical protein
MKEVNILLSTHFIRCMEVVSLCFFAYYVLYFSTGESRLRRTLKTACACTFFVMM